MKILITGGSGFLGQRVARELLKRGHVNDAGGNAQPIHELVLVDIAMPTNGLLDPRTPQVRSSSPKPLATTPTEYSISQLWSAVRRRPTSTLECA
jgi:NAD(P)-dependent dehydrogenase (short-subunit alcohol dehydrogenase family)